MKVAYVKHPVLTDEQKAEVQRLRGEGYIILDEQFNPEPEKPKKKATKKDK